VPHGASLRQKRHVPAAISVTEEFMPFIYNLKKLSGIGPLLIFVFVVIEGITIYVNQWIGYTIGLSCIAQMIFTVCIVIVLFAGILWFTSTLDLMKTSFGGMKRTLVIKGPFSYVRHPLYATLMFTLPPFFLIWFDDYLYVLPWILIILLSHCIVACEEKDLIKEFGTAYQEYRRYVPALIPYKGASGRNILDKRGCTSNNGGV
jgi:protein-S-isoprenylcysteine O-methyltransferase Ste14